MPRHGRHHITRPVRLMAVVAAVLVCAAAVAFGGTASAGSSDDGRDSGTEQNSSNPDPGDLFGLGGADDGGDGSDGQDGGDSGDGKDGDGQGGGQNKDGGQKDDENKDDENADKGEDEEFPGRDEAAPPDAGDFVNITDVEPGSGLDGKGGEFAGGTFTSECGTSDHRNSDNYQAAPGKENGAQHVHDYVGNTTTDAFSDDDSLQAGGTSCTNGDKSTFYWPVLRDLNGVGDDANADGGGKDGNVGSIMTPTSAEMTQHGHVGQKTEPMPQGLEMITGDAKAKTNGDDNVVSKWTCSGFTDRTTEKYPVCPAGSDLIRFLDFPSCWDGESLQSKADNDAVEFPKSDGSCGEGRKAIPQLRMTLTYDQPEGRAFALDTFPEQQHSPKTDHGNFESLLSEDQARTAADCINSGRNC